MSEFEFWLRGRLAEIYNDRKWLATSPFSGGARRLAAQVAATAGLDTSEPEDGHRAESLVLGLAVHGGDPEPDPSINVIDLSRSESGDILRDLLAAETVLKDPALPSDVTAAVDRWDPGRSARSLVAPIMTSGVIAGRATFGARREAWAALEDKLAIVEVWKAAGIPHGASDTVSLSAIDKLRAAQDRLAGPAGTVWAADNSQGFHGGASGTHWVQSEADIAELAERLRADHRSVRVMPFLVGLPCSIHGIVFPRRTVALRPCEMLTYVDLDARRFRYARSGSFWDPASGDREAMVDAAVRVGEELRRRADFRGVFTLDGVLTADGFLPTEVNPRFGAALADQLPTKSGPDINLFLMNMAVIEGSLDPDPDDFEAWAVATLDEHRKGDAMFATPDAPDESRAGTVHCRGLAVDSQGFKLAGDLRFGPETVTAEDLDGGPDGWSQLASVTWEATGSAGMVRIHLKQVTPVGPPTAPLVLELLELTEGEWEVGAGRLRPASSVA